MRFVQAFLFVVALALPVAAEPLDVTDPVPGHPHVTIADLLSQVIPDLAIAADGTATGAVPELPHIAGAGWGGTPPAVLSLGMANLVPFSAQDRPFLALDIALGGSDERVEATQLLAVFDESLALVDAVDIGLDRLNGLGDAPTFRVGAGEDILVARGGHFNSNQSYDTTLLVEVRGDALSLIDMVQMLSDRSCGWEHWQSLALSATEDGSSRWPITATVTDELVLTGEGCGDETPPGEPFSREVVVTYRWSASLEGYVADSDAFLALAEENADRF